MKILLGALFAELCAITTASDTPFDAARGSWSAEVKYGVDNVISRPLMAFDGTNIVSYGNGSIHFENRISDGLWTGHWVELSGSAHVTPKTRESPLGGWWR